MGNSRVLTFDVGGSHVAAAVCSNLDYRLGLVVSALHDTVETSAAFIDLLSGLGAEAASGCDGAMPVTLAVPGPFDLEAGISLMRHKLPFLYGVDLRHALAQRFGCEPDEVLFLNDANAFLQGEVGAGAARGFGRAIGLTLGTGVGSAFTVDGRVVTNGPGVPKEGEIWNLPYESGTVEDFVSGRAITAAYVRRTGKTLSAAELAAAAPGDPAAQEAFAEFGGHLGQVIAGLLDEFAADVVVLGGGIARSPEWFLPATCARLQGRPIELRVSELQERAALVGCAVAWFAGVQTVPLADEAATARSSALPN
jgi:glucokinase